ncbi:hypothetical protein JW752_05225 [Candidatus Peregrinibacteria bacterium]|nr:hypothetical protein [Candidatus Peregrinibacteria bacterium]
MYEPGEVKGILKVTVEYSPPDGTGYTDKEVFLEKKFGYGELGHAYHKVFRAEKPGSYLFDLTLTFDDQPGMIWEYDTRQTVTPPRDTEADRRAKEWYAATATVYSGDKSDELVQLISLNKTSKSANKRLDPVVVMRKCNFKAAGKKVKFNPGYQNEKVTNLPVPNGCKNKKVKVRLFSANELGQEDGSITSDQALAALKKKHCVPADWTTLMPLEEKYEELLREIWILGLGSTVKNPNGDPYVAILRTPGPSLWDSPEDPPKEPELSLFWFEHTWYESIRFAAICK